MAVSDGITLSVVSHGQAALIDKLFRDIEETGASRYLREVVLVQNIPEEQVRAIDGVPLRVVKNLRPKGFGKNHNIAFEVSVSSYFCVINPDIRLKNNPFPVLLRHLKAASGAMIAPCVVNTQGDVEPSARKYPYPWRIVMKVFGFRESLPTVLHNNIQHPDWVGGMFMLFSSQAYREMGGFDERYFMYYEDVELCARLHLNNQGPLYCSDVSVVHDARRDSHRKLRYLRWHVASMLRFFMSSTHMRLLLASMLRPMGLQS